MARQFRDGGDWRTVRNCAVGLSLKPERWHVGMHHDYYDGPHHALWLGPLWCTWEPDDWCNVCMPDDDDDDTSVAIGALVEDVLVAAMGGDYVAASEEVLT